MGDSPRDEAVPADGTQKDAGLSDEPKDLNKILQDTNELLHCLTEQREKIFALKIEMAKMEMELVRRLDPQGFSDLIAETKKKSEECAAIVLSGKRPEEIGGGGEKRDDGAPEPN